MKYIWLCSVMATCLAIVPQFAIALAQLTPDLTDPACRVQWLSRLDVVPCTPHRDTTFPGPNEYGVYFTRIRAEGDHGFPDCRYRNPSRFQTIRNITTLGTSGAKIITSPGFLLIPPQNYPSQVLVNYSIQCSEDELAIVNITDLDLPEMCNGRCTDYVGIDGGFGMTEFCGQLASYNNTDTVLMINTNPFNVIFRSSTDAVVNSGFKATIVCCKREDCSQKLQELREQTENDNTCPALEDIENGAVFQNGTAVGSAAYYVCDAGSVITGDKTRLCLADGTWSGQQPTCVDSTLVSVNCTFEMGFLNVISAACAANIGAIQYRCQIDNTDSFVCEMPYTGPQLLGLSPGCHTFTVFATANSQLIGDPIINTFSI